PGTWERSRCADQGPIHAPGRYLRDSPVTSRLRPGGAGARIFQRFYGFLGGDTSQWYPDLVYDNHQVEPPRTPEEGYHLSEDLVDKAMEFIADVKQVDRPSRSTCICASAPRTRHTTCRRNGRTGTRANSTRAGTPTGSRFSPGRRNSASLPPTPNCHGTIPTCPTGRRCPRPPAACTAG